MSKRYSINNNILDFIVTKEDILIDINKSVKFKVSVEEKMAYSNIYHLHLSIVACIIHVQNALKNQNFQLLNNIFVMQRKIL